MVGITEKSCVALFPLQSLQKNVNENKTSLNGYSDFEESLFWSDSKSIRSNNDNKNDYNDNNNSIKNNNNK